MEAVARLRRSPIAPRKMRLVADLIRGVQADQALVILRQEPKKCASYLEKLLLAAIASWQSNNPSVSLETAGLYIKTIYVDSAGMLKRVRPAPQGRSHRIRKRLNHVTLGVDLFVAHEKPNREIQQKQQHYSVKGRLKTRNGQKTLNLNKQVKTTNGAQS